MYNGQMELGLAVSRVNERQQARLLRRRRAQWWFNQMREVVDRAADWPAVAQPRSQRLHSAPDQA